MYKGGDVLWNIDDVLRVNPLATVECRADVLNALPLDIRLVSSGSTVCPYGLLASLALLGSTFPALLGNVSGALHSGTALREHSFGSERTSSTPLLARCG